MTVLETYLQRTALRKWDGKVADLLLHLVNDLGVKYRLQDANHIFLYPPSGENRPFKASASRPGEQQAKFLQGFLEAECAEQQKAWEKKEAERAARGKAPVAPVHKAPSPTKAPADTEAGTVALRPLGKGRSAYIKRGRGGGVIRFLETDGTTIWCRACEDWSGTAVVGGTSHYRMVHVLGGDPAARKDVTAKRNENREQRKAQQREAVLVLAKAVGVNLGESKADKRAEKKIERLEAQLAKAIAERDAAVAKVAALKEALK